MDYTDLSQLMQVQMWIVNMWPGAIVEVQGLVDIFFSVFIVNDVFMGVHTSAKILLKLSTVHTIVPGLRPH